MEDEGQRQDARTQSRIPKDSVVKVNSEIASARSTKINSKFPEHSDRDQEAPVRAYAHPGRDDRRLQH